MMGTDCLCHLLRSVEGPPSLMAGLTQPDIPQAFGPQRKTSRKLRQTPSSLLHYNVSTLLGRAKVQRGKASADQFAHFVKLKQPHPCPIRRSPYDRTPDPRPGHAWLSHTRLYQFMQHRRIEEGGYDATAYTLLPDCLTSLHDLRAKITTTTLPGQERLSSQLWDSQSLLFSGRINQHVTTPAPARK